MGYQNENAMRVVFDIETAPLPEAADYLERSSAPDNYKDPVKIAAYIAAEDAKQLDRCGLDVDLCRVVAIGTFSEDEESGDADVVKGGDVDEASLLAAFWCRVENHHLVGFNCLGFDLPVLLRRSLYLGVKAPQIQIDKFKHPRVTDLMQVLSFNGALRLRGLSFYAKRFGFAGQVEDPLTGADMALAVKEGRWEDVRAHVMADVQKAALLAERLGYFSRQGVGAF